MLCVSREQKAIRGLIFKCLLELNNLLDSTGFTGKGKDRIKTLRLHWRRY